MVVNEAMDIVHFRGNTGNYLQQTQGKPSHNLLKMAKEGLAFELRNILHKAKKQKASVIKENIPVHINGMLQNISIEALLLPDTIEPYYLVLFHENVSRESSGVRGATPKKKDAKLTTHDSQLSARIQQLEKELSQSREDMRSITEDQEASNEELQSANEELLSSSEELQSLNEELETGKEELQSTNEELMVVNQEMIGLNEQITASRDYAEAIIANIHEPLLVLDKNLRIKTVNNAFYKTFLLNEKETENVLIYNLGNKQWDIPELRTLLEKILPGKSVINNFEITKNFSNIGERVMLLNARGVVNKNISEKLILLSIEDITERKKAQELLNKSGEHFRHLVKELPEAIFSCDVQGRITFYNKSAAKLFGRELEIEKDFWYSSIRLFNMDGSPLPVENSSMSRVIKEGRAIEGKEKIIERQDGSRSIVITHPQPEFDLSGKITGAINIAIDITEEKRIQKDLYEATLFAEMATLIAEEAKQKAELHTQIAEDAVKAKQQFLSNMSHEIRTPMNAIIGFTKVLLKTELTAKQKEYLNAIKLSGSSLIVIINDILDLAKIEAGKMMFEQIPFKMEPTLSAIIHLFDTKIEEKNLQLIKIIDPKIPAVLLGDPVRLNQIILNLISNAVKFTDKGKITIAAHMLSEDDEKVNIEFAVTDTGIGISNTNIESIFENFHQASSSTTRLYGGTGLGLAIAKQLVEAQKGTIKVKSKVNAGSTFSFNLTFYKTNAPVGLKTEIPEIDTQYKNIKVLVVEDMALNQLLMKTLLEDFGFEKDIAANGKIAIEKLKTNSYDIILMDLQMPEMNGFEATEYIRNKMKSEIPIIALTADVTTVDLKKCRAVGINDYLAKPVDERLLYRKIVGLVKKAKKKINKPDKVNKTSAIKKPGCTDLAYLNGITKSDSKLKMEMIEIYLEQTPVLISAMKKGLLDKNWGALNTAAHKLIPSFSIMGINPDFEFIAKKLQDYTGTQLQSNEIKGMVQQLETVCAQACKELKEEYNNLKYTHK